MVGDISAPSKWNALNQFLRDKRVGLIALQETHLDDQALLKVNDLYGRRLCIFNSPACENPTTSQGVALVLNREIVDTSNAVSTTLVPGRALHLDMNWHAGRCLSVLNVYAPNSKHEQLVFWQSVREGLRQHGITPDLILGDFNIVEEAIDRLPARTDDQTQVAALRDCLRPLSLIDGWRTTEPSTRDYTFPARGSLTRSRLDRIYLSESLFQNSYNWSIQTTGIPTDHRAILAAVSCETAPHIGKGRWSMPLHLLHDLKFWKAVTPIALEFERQLIDLGDQRNEVMNPQILLHNLKLAVRTIAKKRIKDTVPRLEAELAASKRKLELLTKKPHLDIDITAQRESATLQDHICELEQWRYSRNRLTTSANYALNAEKPTKYWSALNREKKPRDIIYKLVKPDTDPPLFESRSDRMAELARNYHDALQDIGITQCSTETRSAEINAATAFIRTHLSPDNVQYLSAPTTEK